MSTNFKGKTIGSTSWLQLRADTSESVGTRSSACAWEEPVSLCAPQHWRSWEYLLLLEYPGSETGGDLLANCAGAGCHLGLGLVRKGGGSNELGLISPICLWASAGDLQLPIQLWACLRTATSISICIPVCPCFLFWGWFFFFLTGTCPQTNFLYFLTSFSYPVKIQKKSFICKILDNLVLFFIYTWRLHKHIFRYIYMYVYNTELSWHEIPFSEVAKSVWPSDSYRNLWFS